VTEATPMGQSQPNKNGQQNTKNTHRSRKPRAEPQNCQTSDSLESEMALWHRFFDFFVGCKSEKVS